MIWGDIELGWGHYFSRTKNGAVLWQDVYLDSSRQVYPNKYIIVPRIKAIEYPSTNLFIAVGDSGYVLKTTDRGKTWQKNYVDKSLNFFNLKMLDDKYGIVLCGFRESGKVDMMSTTDGGENWSSMHVPAEYDTVLFNDYQILNKNTVVLLAEFSGSDKRIVWVNGKWDSWHWYPAIDRCRHMFFINENEGWLAGGRKINDMNSAQLIMHTLDGGKTWETQWDYFFDGYGLSDIRFYNDKIGMATGGMGSYLTTYNAGKTWRLDTIKKVDPSSGDAFLSGSLQMPSITTAYVISSSRWIYKYTRDWALGAEDEETENEQLSLDQNRPNPATSRTEISYTLSSYSHVRLNIYDMLGNIRKSLIDEYEGPGEHSIIFTTEGLPQGTYFYRLETGKGSVAKQMVVFR